MVKGEGRVGFLTLGELGVLGANPFRGGGEETRAKDAKDAKVKGRRIRDWGAIALWGWGRLDSGKRLASKINELGLLYI